MSTPKAQKWDAQARLPATCPGSGLWVQPPVGIFVPCAVWICDFSCSCEMEVGSEDESAAMVISVQLDSLPRGHTLLTFSGKMTPLRACSPVCNLLGWRHRREGGPQQQPHPETACPPSHGPFMKETGILKSPPECGPSTATAKVNVSIRRQFTPGQGRPHMEHGFPSSSFALGFVGEVETLSCHFSVDPRGPGGSSKVCKIQNHHQGSWLKSCLPESEPCDPPFHRVSQESPQPTAPGGDHDCRHAR